MNATDRLLHRLECEEGGQMTGGEASDIASELGVDVDDVTNGSVLWVLVDEEALRTFVGYVPAWTDPQAALDQRTVLAHGGVPITGLTIRPVRREVVLESIAAVAPAWDAVPQLLVNPESPGLWQTLIIFDAVVSGGHDDDPHLGRLLVAIDKRFDIASVARREADVLGFGAPLLSEDARRESSARLERMAGFAIMVLRARVDAAVEVSKVKPSEPVAA